MAGKLMPADLRKKNQKAVLREFAGATSLSAVEVSEETGISRQTVKKCIEYYLEHKVLCSCGKGESSSVGGKRPELYCLNPELLMTSVLVHHDEVIVKVSDLRGTPVTCWNSGEVELENLDLVWQLFRSGVDCILSETDIQNVVEVCIVVPLGYDNEKKIQVATPFPKWPTSDYGRSLIIPLREKFPNAIDIEAYSDGRCAGAALMPEKISYREADPLITIYTSHGIGGSLFQKGKIVSGSNNILMAFGHVNVDPTDSEICSCGCHGCIEVLASNRRLREYCAANGEKYNASILSSIPVERVKVKDIFSGAEKGDQFCQERSSYYADIFAVALHNAVLLTAPEQIVFQGVFGNADTVFRRQLIERMSEFKYISHLNFPKIEYDSKDLTEQEANGASYLMLQDYLEHADMSLEGE